MLPTRLLVCCALAASTCAAWAQDASALAARHAAMRDALAASPFGRPLLLQSSDAPRAPRGDVYVLLDHPIAHVAEALRRAEVWCDALILPFNVKQCVPRTANDPPRLEVAIGRKSADSAAQASRVDFTFDVRSVQADYLSVQVSAESGPLGTRDYRIALEAVAVDARRSFLHLSYAYTTSVAARLATEAYLATTGRDKVGFSTDGHDAAGAPRYVGGLRGVAERNTMRYFLAVETVLGTLALPERARVEARLRGWFAATERYARQLHEMPLDDYLAMKRREVRARQDVPAAG